MVFRMFIIIRSTYYYYYDAQKGVEWVVTYDVTLTLRASAAGEGEEFTVDISGFFLFPDNKPRARAHTHALCRSRPLDRCKFMDEQINSMLVARRGNPFLDALQKVSTYCVLLLRFASPFVCPPIRRYPQLRRLCAYFKKQTICGKY